MEWEQKNNMAFNLDKFKWLQIGKNDKLKNSYNYFTGEFDEVIILTDQTKCLGIIMAEDASFKAHVDTIHSKVTKRINWI